MAESNPHSSMEILYRILTWRIMGFAFLMLMPIFFIGFLWLPEKWLTDSVEQNGIGNAAINGQNVGVTIFCMEQIEAFRQELISQIIMLDIDPVAKDAVLKTITAFKGEEK